MHACNAGNGVESGGGGLVNKTGSSSSPLSSSRAGIYKFMFVVPKKDGGNRPAVNLKPLNQYLVYEHFKMEGAHMLRD